MTSTETIIFFAKLRLEPEFVCLKNVFLLALSCPPIDKLLTFYPLLDRLMTKLQIRKRTWFEILGFDILLI